MRGTAEDHYAGIDVPLKESSVCVVDAKDKVVREAQAREMGEAGIVVEAGALVQLDPRDDRMDVRFEGHETPLSFDVIYPALSCRPRAELAAGLGMELLDGGSVPGSAVWDSGVPGVFAAGDVVEDFDQVSDAMAYGAMAATNAHNGLR